MKKLKVLLVVVLSFAFLPFGFLGCKKSESDTLPTYDITLSYNEKDNSIDCKTKVDYTNNSDNEIKELKFNLFMNAYRENATLKPVRDTDVDKKNITYSSLKIKKVIVQKDEGEYSVCGKDENILSVPLKNSLFPDESAEVTIEYNLVLPKINHRLGVTEKTVNLGNFYPILCAYEKEGFYECEYSPNGDPFYSNCANYKVNFTLPKEYIVASSGELLKEETKGNLTTRSYSIDKARDFALVISNCFSIETKISGDTEIFYYYYNDEKPSETVTAMEKGIKYYNSTFGKYPYKTFSVVQTAFLQGGMEYPALVYVSDNLSEKAKIEVAVHELAHQWWYGVVGNNEIEYGFLDEGLTEYSTMLFYDNYKEYGFDRLHFVSATEKSYHTICDVHKQIKGAVDTSMLRKLNDYSTELEYVNIAYNKGFLLFEHLRQTTGNKKFFKGLKNYYEKYAFKEATPDSLSGVYEKLGIPNGFFNSFYNGTAII